MKNLIKIISLGLFVLGLANCGGGGGGTPPSQAATDANQIQINNNGSVITWSESSNNIYVSTSSSCIKGLNNDGADDPDVKAKFDELALLINSSLIGKGTQTSTSSDSIYLTIRYNSGDTRTFNLKTELASTDEETLSNGAQIIEFFNNVDNNIQQSGTTSCNNGKK